MQPGKSHQANGLFFNEDAVYLSVMKQGENEVGWGIYPGCLGEWPQVGG